MTDPMAELFDDSTTDDDLEAQLKLLRETKTPQQAKPAPDVLSNEIDYSDDTANDYGDYDDSIQPTAEFDSAKLDELQAQAVGLPIKEIRLPVLFDHCVRTYMAMLDQTVVNNDGEPVWEGFLTKLIMQKLGYAAPMYTKITRALLGMSCIMQSRRGGGGSPSQYVMITRPTQDAFVEYQKATELKEQTENVDTNKIPRDVNERARNELQLVINRVNALEADNTKLTDALAAMLENMRRMQARLDSLDGNDI